MSRVPRPYRPVVQAARPVECLDYWIPYGVAPVRSENFKIMLIRDGAAQLRGDFGVRTVAAGDLVMLRAGLECGSVSLAPVDVVTAYLNPTFLVDQLRWTMPGFVQDRRAVFREMVRVVPDVRSVPLTDDQFGLVLPRFHGTIG